MVSTGTISTQPLKLKPAIDGLYENGHIGVPILYQNGQHASSLSLLCPAQELLNFCCVLPALCLRPWYWASVQDCAIAIPFVYSTVSYSYSPSAFILNLSNTKMRDGRTELTILVTCLPSVLFSRPFIQTGRERHYMSALSQYPLFKKKHHIAYWHRLHSTLEFSALNPSEEFFRNFGYLFFV